MPGLPDHMTRISYAESRVNYIALRLYAMEKTKGKGGSLSAILRECTESALQNRLDPTGRLRKAAEAILDKQLRTERGEDPPSSDNGTDPISALIDAAGLRQK